MPSFRYAWPVPWSYPETRDLSGVLLGDVNPDDVRDLDEAPDDKWAPAFPADDPDRPAASAPKQEWQEYATSSGAASEGEAADMTKAQLKDLTAPAKAEGGKSQPSGKTDTKTGAAGKEA